ncbi:unnamed protein product [Polarella glacialis]|uniref:RING-type domain-containing protein n=1 Tax=Polarella glacialis TaxID=89957 RepID=A0A813KE54_POLGL|nr:unnamed protein product [Polarella glacialis]
MVEHVWAMLSPHVTSSCWCRGQSAGNSPTQVVDVHQVVAPACNNNNNHHTKNNNNSNSNNNSNNLACCQQLFGQTSVELFAPCMVCAIHAASVLEVPCGHATVCGECFSDYQDALRCLRCRAEVTARVDVEAFLDEFTGRPVLCQLCGITPVDVLGLPCAHMSVCSRCLPAQPQRCSLCYRRLEQTCKVRWASSGYARGTAALSSQGPPLIQAPRRAPPVPCIAALKLVSPEIWTRQPWMWTWRYRRWRSTWSSCGLVAATSTITTTTTWSSYALVAAGKGESLLLLLLLFCCCCFVVVVGATTDS